MWTFCSCGWDGYKIANTISFSRLLPEYSTEVQEPTQYSCLLEYYNGIMRFLSCPRQKEFRIIMLERFNSTNLLFYVLPLVRKFIKSDSLNSRICFPELQSSILQVVPRGVTI